MFKEFITEGPLYSKCILPNANQNVGIHFIGGVHLRDWQHLGTAVLEKIIQLDSSVIHIYDKNSVKAVQKSIFHLYLPLYFWIRGEAVRQNVQQSNTTFFVGINGPQGCGKTTLVTCLEALFRLENFACYSLSLDDFYLTAHGQQLLHNRYMQNRLLEYRGNAGTHDLELARKTLNAIKFHDAISGQAIILDKRYFETINIPFFDKSINSGRGDRVPFEKWRRIQYPIQILLFEGWMLGFRALPEDHCDLKKIGDPSIYQVNTFLKEYSSLYSLINCWIILKTQNLNSIFSWRKQQERRQRQQRKRGLSDGEVEDFIKR
ncbi:glycerate kinase [Cardiosporidium cionae]|uniref:Glycerate kinase n=1 Tax=Cardiosporidium cionae TaxID=476202 RepID=A0ABQ7JD10_9APIC|nr:glycerate kinase [Cardiosporidium cionae]|eukprot:KAF8821805.1 glycerate kinase [Cardiosporidium cionae]